MKKGFKIAYAVLFFAICAAPTALMPFMGSSAEIEKKELTEMPAFVDENGINVNFSTQFESWFNDRLPMRPELLSAANLIKGGMLNTSSSNVISSSGWLFYDDEKKDFMNTNAMTDSQITAAAVTLSLLEEKVTGDGGRFTFVPAPNKSSVYPEHMPVCYMKADENNLTRLTAKLSELGVNYTDLLKVLTGNKNTANGIYHARDSHWNNLGAMIGYNEIMNSLGRPHNAYENASYSYSQVWRADLDKLLYPAGGFMDWQYEFDITYSDFMFTKPTGVRDTAAQLAIFMSDKEENDINISTRNINKPANKSLYMVRDSFGRALLPFMIDNYTTADFVRTNRPELTGSFADKDFVYEIVERNLKNVISTAPYMFAPERTGFSADGLASGGSAEAVFSDVGYAYRLYGKLPEDAAAGDGRVYVIFDNGDEKRTFEAFPIFEKELLKEDGTNGFSAFIDKKAGLYGSCALTIVTGGRTYSAGTAEIGGSAPEKQEVPDTQTDEQSTEPEQNTEAQQPAAGNSMLSGMRFTYNGVEFGLYDDAESVVRKLGEQVRPSEKFTPCVGNSGEMDQYFYKGFSISADANGKIRQIMLNEWDTPDDGCVTVTGIKLGSSADDIKAVLGEPAEDNGGQLDYKDGGRVYSFSLSEEGTAMYIYVGDLN